LRTKLGLTVEQVAERLMCSPSKVSRMETGQRGATLRDVRDLCDLYGVADQVERDRMMTLAREAKQQGWWQAYGLPYSTYVGLEAEAVSISQYQSGVVPGLVQTAEYARVMGQNAVGKYSSDVIDQWVEAKLTRQKLLTRDNPPYLWILLDEGVLRRPVGGEAVMAAQMERLVEVSSLPNVTLQVIPYSAGAHPAMEDNFRLLEFQGASPPLVFSEGLLGFVYLERSEDIERHREVFERLQSIAQSSKDSAAFIVRIYKSYQLAEKTAG
jgi:transcriptional regulator with XRE-family HTH domain